MTHQFDPTILRECDIRGIMGESLRTSDARAVGMAFGSVVARSGGHIVGVAYDGRLSSPALEAALVEGLISAGIEVQRLGCGPTPMLYYAAQVRKLDGAVMVTGSHNPPTHNGFKFVRDGKPFFGEQIRELGRLAAAGDWQTAAGGLVIDRPLHNVYLERLISDYAGTRPLTVVWDAGNGATGEILAALAARLPGRHVVLNSVIDGHFPAHHPDPTVPENLQQLIEAVAREGADLGFAFDGDGDRLGVVAPQGRILWGDQMMMLLSEEVLAQSPGALIMADVKASQCLSDHIAALGGVPRLCPTGHSIIKSIMADSGASLAGDMSGHLFFADRYYGYDDALYAAVRFLSMVARWPDRTLAERYDALPRHHITPEMRIPCPENGKFGVIAELQQRLADSGTSFTAIDGVRVTTEDGWWLLRASNTQAMLVARCESPTADGLQRLKTILAGHLTDAGICP